MTEAAETPVKMAAESSPAGQTLLHGTEYVVLKSKGGSWDVVSAKATGKSAEAAIKSVVEKASTDQPGTYVAVPFRSWKPVAVKTRVETTLTLEDVKA